MRTVHSSTPRQRFPCDKCSKTFVNKTRLRNHIITFYHGQRPYPCKHCSQRFTQKWNLERHINSIHLGVKYSGHLCGLELNSKQNVNQHIRAVHEKQKPYTCSYCQKSFTLKNALKMHVDITHKVNLVEFKCTKCTKIFFRMYNLSCHMIRKISHILVQHVGRDFLLKGAF